MSDTVIKWKIERQIESNSIDETHTPHKPGEFKQIPKQTYKSSISRLSNIHIYQQIMSTCTSQNKK